MKNKYLKHNKNNANIQITSKKKKKIYIIIWVCTLSQLANRTIINKF